MQCTDGDENIHTCGVDVSSGSVRDFTPFQGVLAGLVGMDEKFPNEILVQLDARNREAFDAYRL